MEENDSKRQTGRKPATKLLSNKKKNDEQALKCEWDNCEMCLKRGDQQKQVKNKISVNLY